MAFSQKIDFYLATVKLQLVIFEVNDALVTLEHIKSKQQVNVHVFHHMECTIQEHPTDTYRGSMHTSKDLPNANATSLAVKSGIDKPHDSSFLRALLGHDRGQQVKATNDLFAMFQPGHLANDL